MICNRFFNTIGRKRKLYKNCYHCYITLEPESKYMLEEMPRHMRVLDVAYKLFCKEGLSALNAKNIRKAGNFSTQSIYSTYVSRDHLRDIVIWKALKEAKLMLSKEKLSSIIELDLKLIEIGKKYPGWAKTLLNNGLLNQLFLTEATQISMDSLSIEADEYVVKLNMIYIAGALSLNLDLERAFKQEEFINVIQNQIQLLNKMKK